MLPKDDLPEMPSRTSHAAFDGSSCLAMRKYRASHVTPPLQKMHICRAAQTLRSRLFAFLFLSMDIKTAPFFLPGIARFHFFSASVGDLTFSTFPLCGWEPHDCEQSMHNRRRGPCCVSISRCSYHSSRYLEIVSSQAPQPPWP